MCVQEGEREREQRGRSPEISPARLAAASEGDEGERRDGGRSFFISSF